MIGYRDAASRALRRPAGPGSPAWKIHAEVALLLGWGRAILMQLAHPLVAQGVADHSTFRTTPGERWRRLHRTLGAMLTLTFGPDQAAARIIDGINAIHDRVQGVLPVEAGALPPGTRYTARDPRLLEWVHATVLDSFLLTYETYVAPLSGEERDRYCVEAGATAVALGVPPADLPRSVGDLQRYLARMRASGAIAVTATARALAGEVIAPPVPPAARPLVGFMRLTTVGLLPEDIRAGYGFEWSARRAAALRGSARVIRRVLPLLPSVVRHWPEARAARRRWRRAAGRGAAVPAPTA